MRGVRATGDEVLMNHQHTAISLQQNRIETVFHKNAVFACEMTADSRELMAGV